MRYFRPGVAPPYRLIIALLMPAVLLVIGTAGYCIVEEWPLLDALYMTVLTLTTVGFREVHELTDVGRLFTMALALGGIFTFFYATTTVIAAIMSGEMLWLFGSHRMEQELSNLSNHFIICGFGRIGRLVCQDFAAQKLPFVVIDKKGDILKRFAMSSGIALNGDATDDNILERAGIRRARALISVVASDSDNLFITMSARLLNEKLFIVARAEDEHSEKKLLRAGASKVVSPYVIGGSRIAQAVLRPTVVDFLELATRTEHLELNIEEARIASGSNLPGTTLAGSGIGQEHGLITVAVKQTSGKMTFNPRPDFRLTEGDILIMLGRRTELDRAAAMASNQTAC